MSRMRQRIQGSRKMRALEEKVDNGNGATRHDSFTATYSPGRTFGLPFRGFLITHIETHGRTPLDE
jgi:hypothetical protein